MKIAEAGSLLWCLCGVLAGCGAPQQVTRSELATEDGGMAVEPVPWPRLDVDRPESWVFLDERTDPPDVPHFLPAPRPASPLAASRPVPKSELGRLPGQVEMGLLLNRPLPPPLVLEQAVLRIEGWLLDPGEPGGAPDIALVARVHVGERVVLAHGTTDRSGWYRLEFAGLAGNGLPAGSSVGRIDLHVRLRAAARRAGVSSIIASVLAADCKQVGDVLLMPDATSRTFVLPMDG
jgi:hypothetical protein